MSFWAKLEKGLTRVAEEVAKSAERQRRVAANSQYAKHRNDLISGRSLAEWEQRWKPAGSLDSDISHLSQVVRLYRARLGGQVVYVGRAVEWNNGGLRKRLRDYTRASDSSRKHGSGQLMHQHASDIRLDILVTGDCENAAAIAKRLEPLFVGSEPYARAPPDEKHTLVREALQILEQRPCSNTKRAVALMDSIDRDCSR